MSEIELLQNALVKQRQYIEELKDIIETYESIIKDYIVERKGEMSDNEELWQKYINGELNAETSENRY
jgi:hypothetical protein